MRDKTLRGDNVVNISFRDKCHWTITSVLQWWGMEWTWVYQTHRRVTQWQIVSHLLNSSRAALAANKSCVRNWVFSGARSQEFFQEPGSCSQLLNKIRSHNLLEQLQNPIRFREKIPMNTWAFFVKCWKIPREFGEDIILLLCFCVA